MASSVSIDVREGGKWSRPQRIKNDAIYAAVRCALAVVAWLPKTVVAAITGLVAAIAYVVSPRLRARAAERLGGRATARDVFRGLGAIAADTLALLDPSERASSTLAIDPPSHAVFREALDEGRGVVFVTAHLGPWERMAALLVEDGFPVATVARESYDPRFTELYERIRAPRGVRSIYRGRPSAALAIVRELARGRAVGFLVDLPGRVETIDVELFGRRARFPVGPLRIALARGAAVVVGTPTLGTATKKGSVAIERIAAADLAGGAEGEAALAWRIARALERRVESSPEAWMGALG